MATDGSIRVVLRPYQVDALSRYRQRVDAGARRILMVAPTGAGKATLAAQIILDAVDAGQRALFLAHRRELIVQAYERVLRMGVPDSLTGVLMGGDARRRPGAPVQVASVDTLRHRAKPQAELVIIDEAHRSTAQGYRDISAAYPNAVHLGFTATPYRADGKGLREAYDELIVVASPRQLMADGFLVEPRVFTVPHSKLPDLSSVKVKRGDYDSKALAEAVDRAGLVGNLVEHWQEHAADLRTVVFAASIQHSKHIAERFREAGIATEHLDGTMPLDVRDGILTRLESGETRVVSNVNVLCLDENTEILTTEGWIGIDQMTGEHSVAGWRDGAIEFERPLEVIRRERAPGERMVRIRTDSVEARVTEDHNLVYRTGKTWLKKPARELVGRAFKIPTCGRAASLAREVEAPAIWTRKRIRRAITQTKWNVRHLEGKTPAAAREEAVWRVARKMALYQKSPADLSLAECGFIGFWLGDGSITRLKTGGVEYKIFESSRNREIVSWLDGIVETLGVDFIKRELPPHEHTAEVKYRRTHPCYAWSFPRGTGGGSQSRSGLYHLEPYLERYGSALYWALSDEQFAALLHGFWMADGNHLQGARTLPTSFCLYNVRKPLLDLLQAIACCRGYQTSLRKLPPDGLYILSFTRRQHLHVLRPRIRFEAEWKPERVWCVRTRAGNIVTRFNGAVAVLGNCEGYDQPSVKCAILARPTKSTGLYLQMAGRILRPWNNTRAIILDHAGCAVEHGLPQDDREFSLDPPPKKKSRGPLLRPCPECFAVLPLPTRICPECSTVLREDEPERSAPKEVQGKLQEITISPLDEQRDVWAKLCEMALLRGYRPGWAYVQFRERFGRPVPKWFPPPRERTDADKRTRLGELLSSDGSAGWAKLRYRLEFGEAPPEA